MGDTRIENCTGYPCWCSWGSLIRIASLTPADGSNSMIPISKLYLVLFLYLRWQVTWRVTTQPTMITFLRFVLPQLFLDLLQVDFLWVLTNELFCLKGFGSYFKFTREKMIDICCVESGVKYHSSYWWIVITAPVEISTNKFRTNLCKKSFKMA